MAQTGYTPISSYFTTTASAVPTAGNLVNGELALNISTSDGKLFYKDSAGVVQVLATKDSASGSFVNLTYTGTLTGGTGVVNLGSGQFYKDASGNVGIGTSSPSSILDVVGSGNPTLTIRGSAGAYTSFLKLQAAGGGSSVINATGASSDFLVFQITGSERMRIDSSGNLLVGSSSVTVASVGSASTIQAQSTICSFGGGAGLVFQNRSGIVTSTTNWYMWYATSATVYLWNNGNAASINTSTGAYTALSDATKKKDFSLSTLGLDAVMQLKPTLYRMKTEDESAPLSLGFIAQDVKNVIPQAYIESQAEDANGNPDTFIGLQDRPIIAVLTKAIQELNAKVTALEAQLGVK
jgi:hypothetical protein